jgi:superfamily II DNA or RNA helicase
MNSLFKSRDERQEEARVKWIKNKCKGSIVACTGFGKTRVAINCINSIINHYSSMKFLVVVPTDNLKIQWEQCIDNNGLSLNGKVVIVNTAIKNQYITDILVIDEAHRVNSKTFRDIFNTIKYKYILGLTATYERLDGLHKEVMEKYCPVIDTINLEEALFNGWVSQFKEYQVLISVNDIDVYNEYNKEFQQHFEFFNYDFNLAMSLIGPKGFINRAKLRDERCPHGTDEERKAVFRSITYHATGFMRVLQKRKSFINNHPKKIEIARKIIEARGNSKIITFSNNIKMAESIGMGGQVYTGRDNKKKARANLSEFNEATTGLIHSVNKLIEGADVKGLSVGIILGLDSSETKAVQKRGRCIRFEEGKTAELFNIVIEGTIESKWFSNSHKNSVYTTIDEQGLQDVLNGREPKPYVKPIKDFQFRF